MCRSLSQLTLGEWRGVPCQSVSYRQTMIHTHIHEQFQGFSELNLHVFGMWEQFGRTLRKRTQARREHAKLTHKGQRHTKARAEIQTCEFYCEAHELTTENFS